MVRSWPVLVLAALATSGCSPRPVARPPVEPPVAAKRDAAPADPTALAPPQPTLRLPRNFVPTRYAARLELDPARTDFKGSISITGVVDQPSAVIWLHGKELVVGKATATKDATEVPITVTARGEDLLELRPARTLERGEWTLMMDYTGKLDVVSSAGAFRQAVGDGAYIYTQLEAIYARRVFPCFDEPDNKVPWKLTLDVPNKLVAVANTPIVAEVPLAGDTKRVEFTESKPLPTYLVAFGVGPFEIVDAGTSKRGTPVRVLALANRSADAAWAAKTSARLLDLTEDWFGTPYPYEKLDMLTIPVTVGFGAMENAGLITFTESLILHDAKASKGRKHAWVIVAAHEIAHQWFGNLVTMKYWDDIWLNEGFANWLESKIATKFDPSWREAEGELWTRNGALGADSLVSARQIRQPIETDDDIQTAFDGITYNKGASVLNMFEAYLGPEVFQRGVRDYLAARAWGNATSTDFATALAKAAGKDYLVPAFMTFLEQAGAPEITATIRCDGSPSIELAQRRYLPPGAPPPPTTKPWIFPVCVAYDAGGKRAQTCSLLERATGSIALDTKTCPRWVMPNVEGRGYFRTGYTAAQLAALRDEAWPHLSWTERRTIFFDASEGAYSGRTPLQLTLSLVPRLLVGGDRFTVPTALGLPIRFDHFVRDDLRPKYEWWLRQTFGPGALKAGWTPKEGDSLDVESMRVELLSTVAWTAREPTLVEQAIALADRWQDLPQSIRALVLDIAVDARADIFDKVIGTVGSISDRTRRREALSALASVRDVSRHSRALALVLDRTIDIRESLWLVFQGATEANEANAQKFLRDNLDSIMKRLPTDSTTFSHADLAEVFTSTCKADQRDAIAAYVTKTFSKYSGGERTVKQAIEGMDQCIAKRKLIEPELVAWLGGIRIPKASPKAGEAGPDKKDKKPEKNKKANKP